MRQPVKDVQGKLGHLGSISALAFGMAIMGLGVIFYLAAGRPRRVLQVSTAD